MTSTMGFSIVFLAVIISLEAAYSTRAQKTSDSSKEIVVQPQAGKIQQSNNHHVPKLVNFNKIKLVLRF